MQWKAVIPRKQCRIWDVQVHPWNLCMRYSRAPEKKKENPTICATNTMKTMWNNGASA